VRSGVPKLPNKNTSKQHEFPGIPEVWINLTQSPGQDPYNIFLHTVEEIEDMGEIEGEREEGETCDPVCMDFYITLKRYKV